MKFRESMEVFGAAAALAVAGCVVGDVHDSGTGGSTSSSTTSSSASTSGTSASTTSTTSTGATTASASSGGTTTSSSSTTSSSTSASSSSSSGAVGCTGKATVLMHFTNVAPAPGAIDFCLGTNGNLSGPLAKIAGAPGGLSYGTVMDYGYDVEGPIDIRVIAAGGSCSGTSLGDSTNVCLTPTGSQGSASVYYLTKQGAGPLAVLTDEVQDAGSLRLRFFNAVVGVPDLDFGLTDASALPTVVSTAVASNIPFGHFPPQGNTILNIPVNKSGYLDITTMPAGVKWAGWGAAVSGGTAASAVVPFSTVTSNLGVSLTIVAVGKTSDPTYPVHFLGYSGSTTTKSKVPVAANEAAAGLN